MLEFGNLLSPAFSLLSGLFILLPLAVYVAPFAVLFLWLSHPGVPSVQHVSAPVAVKIAARNPWAGNRGPLGLCPHYTDGMSAQQVVALSASASPPILSSADFLSVMPAQAGIQIWIPAFAGMTRNGEFLSTHDSVQQAVLCLAKPGHGARLTTFFNLASLPPTLYSAQSHGRAPPRASAGIVRPLAGRRPWSSAERAGQGPRAPPVTEKIA